MKLGTLLLRNAAIGLNQLESALRNQVLYGGRLGTNLVELGFLDLELLANYLAELTGLPVATPALLDTADPGLVAQLGADVAHRLRAVPLGPRPDLAPDAIAVALVDPSDAAACRELAELFDRPIVPYVVPELRALYYLEKLFGLPRRARYVRSGTEPATPSTAATTDDRRRTQPVRGMVIPPSFTLEPRRRRPSQAPQVGDRTPPTLTFGGACEQIDTATTREQIGDAWIAYAHGRVDALIAFIIRDGNALGWRGYSTHQHQPDFGELSLPLGGASALQAAHDSGQIYVGPPPSAAHPVETQLWAALGATPDPPGLVVVPILVKQRPINLIYAHLAVEVPHHDLVAELVDLASRSQTSYLRLIRQARG